MSLVSLYYYLQVLRQAYVSTAPHPSRFRIPLLLQGAVVVLALGVFFVGLYPAPLFEVTGQRLAGAVQLTATSCRLSAVSHQPLAVSAIEIEPWISAGLDEAGQELRWALDHEFR